MQLTAWTGIYGATFVIYTTTSLLVEAGQQSRAGQRGGQSVGLALLLVCFGLGWPRVHQ